MIFLGSWLFYIIYDGFHFCPVNVLSCRDNHFWIFYLFFAAGPSDSAALRLKYARKTIIPEKNNNDKSTFDESTKTFDSNFEIFYFHFEFYCVWNDLQNVCIVKKCSKKYTSSFQQKETIKCCILISKQYLLCKDIMYIKKQLGRIQK